MISLERFNKQKHRYIYNVRWCGTLEAGYIVDGCIGTKSYHAAIYSLKDAIKMYNAEAKRVRG